CGDELPMVITLLSIGSLAATSDKIPGANVDRAIAIGYNAVSSAEKQMQSVIVQSLTQ
ncbi:Hsf, partial [Pasteurella multocida subsp. gallicida str. Anand1_poultry]